MPKIVWLLVIGMVVNVTGSSFLWPLNAIYIHDHLGKSLSVAGIVLMLNAAASVVGNLYGGHLYDKIGGFKSVMLGIGITFISLIGLTFWHGWPHYVIFLIMIGFGSGVVHPAMYAMAGTSWKSGGRKAFNAMYVAANIGVAIGSALGGLVASLSFNYIFFANMVFYFVYLLIAFFGYRSISDSEVRPTTIIQEKKRFAISKNLISVLIISTGFFLCWMAYVQWQTTIATYTQEINISLSQYSLLWTINGALIVFAQPVLSIFTKKVKSLKTQIIIGLFVFIAAFSVASISELFIGFVTAMVIMTVGEMLIWPAVPTIANDLAPKGKEGFYQGVVNSAATCGRMIGPLLGGLIADYLGMSYLFVILIVLFFVAMITTLTYDRVIKKQENVKSIQITS